ncbi:MAG: bifunctional glutamate N-acetyltransferase/amino-acid acetyltransferase ArgJ [Planctomycetota bacterium]
MSTSPTFRLIQQIEDGDLPKGFSFGSAACGIKPSGKLDVSLVTSQAPCSAAGVFTKNQIVAAPVVWCQDRTPSENIHAVITNSGNANACTGEQGARDNEAMAKQVADKIGCEVDQVLVMSTGVIGKPLPMAKVLSGIDESSSETVSTADAFSSSAHAILTTDQDAKCVAASLSIDGQTVRLAAMAKGAGMIAPNMATMLCVIMTDGLLPPSLARELISSVCDDTFNQASVDGHTSTNDTVLLLSSGQTGIELEHHQDAFKKALHAVAEMIVKMLVADGEGADRFMTIEVQGTQTDNDARIVARSIGDSPLVKTAIYGCDPNWGRIVSAAGYSKATIDPNKTSLYLFDTPLYLNGQPVEFDDAALSQKMKDASEVTIRLNAGEGPGRGKYYASDLSVAYVRFNSEYTT